MQIVLYSKYIRVGDMKDFTLNKLWDLRAELDNAIINKDYDRIKAVKVKYQNLIEGEKWFSHAFICYNHGFYTDGERGSHNYLNINSILRNIEDFERKYIDNEQVSVKLKTQSTTPFLAGEIWVLRAMYDKFLIRSQSGLDELQTEQNMIWGKAVYDRLRTLAHMEQTESYHDQIRAITQEVRESYESIYGKQQPIINYSQIAEEYLEK